MSKAKPEPAVPLADRLRPQSLDDVVGQEHLLDPGQPLRTMADSGALRSLILWGPPGCGKTTLARLLAEQSGLHFESLSAVFSGVAELRQVFERARQYKKMDKATVVFVDEIHRFNKAQQDAFLPVVEDGTIILIGATTENPSFALNSALLSRCPVMILRPLDEAALEKILHRAEKLLGQDLPVTTDARALLIQMADGDGRYALTLAETLFAGKHKKPLEIPELQTLLQKRAPLYDSNEEGHYNLISALHKSVRGSDVDAALYWLARMMDGGEDLDYLARRIVRMAAEDIGLADPQALPLCLAAWQGVERLGSPEGELFLAEAVAYLAMAPKSNAIYTGFKAAMRLARETGSHMPPKHAINAPTKLMKQAGYSSGYIYDHDTPEGYAGLNYFPPQVPREVLYQPVARGYEREMQKRLAYFAATRKK